MKNAFLVPELRELIEQKDFGVLREVITSAHPAELAPFIASLEPAEILVLFEHIPLEAQAAVFTHLEIAEQEEFIAAIDRERAADILEQMPPDDRADLIKQLDDDLVEDLLPRMARAERENVKRLVQYMEGTAGALMTTDYASLPSHITVQEALQNLRLAAPDKETIYYVYVLDADRGLVGLITLKDLILAKPQAVIADIMQKKIVKCGVDQDQEDVAQAIEKYNLIAVPVVDAQDRLLGIVTHDDAVDVIREEETEDVQKSMGIAADGVGERYLDMPVLTNFRRRVVWIIILVVVSFISVAIIEKFRYIFSSVVILSAFLPLIIGTGGNAGAQSATLVIRALALNELNLKSFLAVIWKEVRVGIILGAVIGLCALARVYVLPDAVIPVTASLSKIGFVVSGALFLHIVSATLIGSILPLVVTSVRLDPAVISNPALTTILDITGLLIYFAMAHAVLF
jgi:magnesium transporter